MARPVEYDRQLVLKEAMKVFWLKGYEPTSMADLLEATGLTSRSLYNVFGSKNGLFKAALDNYYQWGISPALAQLKAGRGAAAVREYVLQLNRQKPLNGCLFVNTLTDKNSVEKDSLKKVQAFFKDLEATVKEKLTYAQKHEGFQGDPALKARQVVAFMHGLAIYSKLNHGLAEQRRMAADFLAMLEI